MRDDDYLRPVSRSALVVTGLLTALVGLACALIGGVCLLFLPEPGVGGLVAGIVLLAVGIYCLALASRLLAGPKARAERLFSPGVLRIACVYFWASPAVLLVLAPRARIHVVAPAVSFVAVGAACWRLAAARRARSRDRDAEPSDALRKCARHRPRGTSRTEPRAHR